METLIQETIEEILIKLNSPFRKVKLEKSESTIRANIESEEPSLLIGHHGENIHALQNIVKTILYKKSNGNLNFILDIDNYKKRQEENIKNIAERKINTLIKTGEEQSLPPMAPYFRRLVHLHIASNYPNIISESVGEGEHRYLKIKNKDEGIEEKVENSLDDILGTENTILEDALSNI